MKEVSFGYRKIGEKKTELYFETAQNTLTIPSGTVISESNQMICNFLLEQEIALDEEFGLRFVSSYKNVKYPLFTRKPSDWLDTETAFEYIKQIP